ncbi:YfdX family protein [Acidisoma sp. S159]|uniref:YfdX family protein n=1 Tax=Acidisoma sp. S159 TaxID=1747225 RepID=UPI001C205D5B|nr:YfdX family protein [Acidisoma sp. S159]
MTPALAAQPGPKPADPVQQAAYQDFGKFSADGHKAFADIRLARLAIFNGNTGIAKNEILAAAAALGSAKAEASTYIEAVGAPKPLASNTQSTGDDAHHNVTAVKWLPIDSAMTLGEDYVATPMKAATIAKANAQLKAGDHARAIDTLKLAAINVRFDVEVAPLDRSISGVNKAETLVNAGQYFQANQALKDVQDNVRLDVQNVAGVPQTKTVSADSADQASKPASATN